MTGWRFAIVDPPACRYIRLVQHLTRHEQLVLCVILGLLLTGWAVQTYRSAHPPAQPALTAEP